MACARVVITHKGGFAGPDFMKLYTGQAAIIGRLKEMLYV